MTHEDVAAPAAPRSYKGYDLYPFQRRAIAAIEAGKSVVVAAPTGAGKTLIAEYSIDKALERGRRLVYTAPIKALSNQKFRDFTAAYPDPVGILTGDVTLHPHAPVLIMTTEIFRNTIFEAPERLQGIEYVVFDEIHYMDDEERGTVWEECLIFAPPGIRFVCLSATIPNLAELAAWMEKVRGVPVETLVERDRPVPLRHRVWSPAGRLLRPERVGRLRRPRGRERRDVLDYLEREGLLPCLYFSFSRRECEVRAMDNAHRKLLTPKERRRAQALYDELVRRYGLEGAPEMGRFRHLVGRGVSYHHAGMLPSCKEIMERLFTEGLLKMLFTTETFALGVNMPARTVVFNSMYKFDGVSFDVLRTVDYHQMAGRAGRQGIDTEGLVIIRLDPRDHDPEALRRMICGELEPVRSRFNLGYSTILNLYARVGGDIFGAYERSFKTFQGRDRAWARERAQLAARLQVLRRAAYLDGEQLTEKGRFACRVFGFEVQLAELFEGGLFRDLDEEDILLILGAIVFAPRRGDPTDIRRVRKLGERKAAAEAVLARFRRLEEECGVEEPTRGLEWGLSRPLLGWARGCTLEDLYQITDVAQGDLIRNFRLTLQLVRQFRRALELLGRRHPLLGRLDAAAALLNRDEVDAERQLLAGAA